MLRYKRSHYLPEYVPFGVLCVDTARVKRCFSLAVLAVELHKAVAASLTLKVPWALFCSVCADNIILSGWFIISSPSSTLIQRKLLQQWAPTMLGGALPKREFPSLQEGVSTLPANRRNPVSTEWDWLGFIPKKPSPSPSPFSLTATSLRDPLQQIIKYCCHFGSELLEVPNIAAFYRDKKVLKWN